MFLSEGADSNGWRGWKELIRQLVESPEYRAKSEEAVPAEFRVPNETRASNVRAGGFWVGAGCAGELQPKLVEMQAFPSLYAYQAVLAETYRGTYGLDAELGGSQLKYFLSGLERDLSRAAAAGDGGRNMIRRM